MRIRQILSQHRRDFTAEYECEGCGHIEKANGYDDAYFHGTVIPAKKCLGCGKSANDLGSDYRPLSTKYQEGTQV